jgi:hypothetical protein
MLAGEHLRSLVMVVKVYTQSTQFKNRLDIYTFTVLINLY